MFDSGVGGLTVLHECLVSLPEEDFVYLGDTEWFPYGTKDTDALRARIRSIAERLLGGRAKLLVIACNTASAACLADWIVVDMFAQCANGQKTAKEAAAEAERRALRYYKV